MTLKDASYYEGLDLVYPILPTKPYLSSGNDSKAFRAYADKLESYEGLLATAKGLRDEYNRATWARAAELAADLAAEYNMSEAKAAVLYEVAYENCHSTGLGGVIEEFDNLFNFVNKFNETV